MAAVEIDKAAVPGPGGCKSGKSSSAGSLCWGAGSNGACEHCQTETVASGRERVRIGQVMLVFFLPLVCAVALVIVAVRYLPGLAEHPGYLVLSALGAGALAVVLGSVLTRDSRGPSEDN